VRTQLQYGRGDLAVEIPSSEVTVLSTKHEEGLPNEATAFREAVRHPIGSAPLKELVGAKDRVAVVIPDITRPLPSGRLLPLLFEELSHVPPENVTIVNGTGSHWTHRTNTEEELVAMVGREVVSNYRVVNHNAHDPSASVRRQILRGPRRVHEPRVRRGRQAHCARLHRAAFHGRVLGRVQRRHPGHGGHRFDHALPPGVGHRSRVQHVGGSRGQPED
jgi:hypothetical protein